MLLARLFLPSSGSMRLTQSYRWSAMAVHRQVVPSLPKLRIHTFLPTFTASLVDRMRTTMMVLTAPVRPTCLRYRASERELTYESLLHPLYTLCWPRLHHHSRASPRLAPLRPTRPPHCKMQHRDLRSPQRPTRHNAAPHRTSAFRNLPIG